MNKNNRLFRRLLRIKSSDLIKPIIFPCLGAMLAISVTIYLFSYLVGFFVTPDFGDTISSLTPEQSGAVISVFWNICVVATSIALTSPLIIGFFEYLYHHFNGKKTDFLSIFSVLSNMHKSARSLLASLLCLAMGFVCFILSTLPLTAIFYLVKLIWSPLLNSIVFEILILLLFIGCLLFFAAEFSSYLWIFVPVIENPELSVWKCFLLTRKTLGKYRWSCFCMTIYNAFLSVITLGIGGLYFAPRYFMNQILLYRASIDLAGNPVNFPPELIPVLSKKNNTDKNDDKNETKEVKNDNKRSKYSNFLNNILKRF